MVIDPRTCPSLSRELSLFFRFEIGENGRGFDELVVLRYGPVSGVSFMLKDVFLPGYGMPPDAVAFQSIPVHVI